MGGIRGTNVEEKKRDTTITLLMVSSSQRGGLGGVPRINLRVKKERKGDKGNYQ